MGTAHFEKMTLKNIIPATVRLYALKGSLLLLWESLCRDNIFASLCYSILWFFRILLKTYNLWKSMAFFGNGNLIFALEVSSKTAFLHVIVTTTLFRNFAPRVGILLQSASQLHFSTPYLTRLFTQIRLDYTGKCIFRPFRFKKSLPCENTNS